MANHWWLLHSPKGEGVRHCRLTRKERDMKTSSHNRSGEVGEDVMIILITAAQLVFFTRFYRVIAWSLTGPDGAVARLSMLTEDYFTWLPFVIVASTLVILGSSLMIIWDNILFRQAAWVGFCIIGITVVVSLIILFPFDFSVLPNTTAVRVVPKAVTAFLILQATFYAVAAVVLFLRLRKRMLVGNH
jgi:hypothetical protein